MKRIVLILVAFATTMTFSFTAHAQCEGKSSTTAKAAMVSYEKDIVDIAMSSDVHQTLVAAVKAADLVSTLKSDGPFTVFAPTDAAFGMLPEGTIPMLLEPENKAALQSILTYHVIAGEFDSAAVVEAIQAGGGKVTLTTVQGGNISAMIDNGNVVLMDENGNRATVTAVDLKGSNGVIHVIDRVVMPATK
jgi:uncharacterized surface protein with fasciclin (FAS1) repeats